MTTVSMPDLPAPPGPYVSAGKLAVRTVDGYSTNAVAVHDGKGRAIALVYAGFGDGLATAQLLAAAPRLLSALQTILTEADFGLITPRGEMVEALDAARATVAEAVRR